MLEKKVETIMNQEFIDLILNIVLKIILLIGKSDFDELKKEQGVVVLSMNKYVEI